MKKINNSDYITIDPKNFGYDEAITDKQSPVFKAYKKKSNSGKELIAVLQGKKGVTILERG